MAANTHVVHEATGKWRVFASAIGNEPDSVTNTHTHYILGETFPSEADAECAAMVLDNWIHDLLMCFGVRTTQPAIKREPPHR